jgi:hypothetical protein
LHGETSPLGVVGGRRLADRHPVGRPDLTAGDADGDSRNPSDPLIGLNDSLSAAVVTSHGASYLHGQCSPWRWDFAQNEDRGQAL